MANVKFSKRVKYKGKFYLPHVTFECDDKDLNKLKAMGATVIEGFTAPLETGAILGIVGEDIITDLAVNSTIETPVVSIDENPKDEPKKSTKGKKKSTKK